jgi:hypothetical protein
MKHTKAVSFDAHGFFIGTNFALTKTTYKSVPKVFTVCTFFMEYRGGYKGYSLH